MGALEIVIIGLVWLLTCGGAFVGGMFQEKADQNKKPPRYEYNYQITKVDSKTQVDTKTDVVTTTAQDHTTLVINVPNTTNAQIISKYVQSLTNHAGNTTRSSNTSNVTNSTFKSNAVSTKPIIELPKAFGVKLSGP